MRQRASVRPGPDGWTATLPLFGFRATPERKTFPTQLAACNWVGRCLAARFAASGALGMVDAERVGWWHDGIATIPGWSPVHMIVTAQAERHRRDRPDPRPVRHHHHTAGLPRRTARR